MPDSELVDDQYWLKFAKDHVTDAIKARDDAAVKLDTLVTWTWGIYTGLFTTAILFDQITDSFLIKLIMALPVVVIPVAKFLCVDVQLPVLTNFYQNVPKSIQNDCYAVIVRSKAKLLKQAKNVALLSAALIGLSLLLFKINYGKPKDPFKSDRLKTELTADKKNILVSVRCSPNQTVRLIVAGSDSTKNGRHYIEAPSITSDADGMVTTLIPAEGITGNITAFATWREKDQQHTIKNE